jgi:hypothetical protein
MRGVLPSSDLLILYPELDHLYGDFVRSIKEGNLFLFDYSFTKLQKQLIQSGTWLTVEKSRNLVLRSLFKKIWLIMDKSSRIPFQTIQKGLEFSANQVLEMDQVECFLACQIDFGYMKGYLSHEKATVVLSKENPFPLKKSN